MVSPLWRKAKQTIQYWSVSSFLAYIHLIFPIVSLSDPSQKIYIMGKTGWSNFLVHPRTKPVHLLYCRFMLQNLSVVISPSLKASVLETQYHFLFHERCYFLIYDFLLIFSSILCAFDVLKKNSLLHQSHNDIHLHFFLRVKFF